MHRPSNKIEAFLRSELQAEIVLEVRIVVLTEAMQHTNELVKRELVCDTRILVIEVLVENFLKLSASSRRHHALLDQLVDFIEEDL